MSATEWTTYDVQELERKVREILTEVEARYPGAYVPLLHLRDHLVADR